MTPAWAQRREELWSDCLVGSKHEEWAAFKVKSEQSV
jgi:hypothetical protein